jgi:hypothetical protein
MQEMGADRQAAKLVAEAIPLLDRINANAPRLTAIAEEVTRVEGRSDELHDQGLKDLFRVMAPPIHGLYHRQRNLRRTGEGRRPLRGRRQRDQRHRDRERLMDATLAFPLLIGLIAVALFFDF